MNPPTSQTEHKSRRTVRWIAPLVVVGGVLLLLALVYLEENWRADFVWRRAKKELEAKGEILDWKHYVPAPPPDDRNMMKVPGMTETFVKGRTGGLMITTSPQQRLSSSNHVRYGEIEVVGDERRAMASLDTLRTNATARRALARYFAGRSLDTPLGLRLTQRSPGSEVKRALLVSHTSIDAKEFQKQD